MVKVSAGLGALGIVAHGVTLEADKPPCLAVCDGKFGVILRGFPTMAKFRFHEPVAPGLRSMAERPPRGTARLDTRQRAHLTSEQGRTEVALVALTEGPGELVAHPVAMVSGTVTSFAEAEGFLTVPDLVDSLPTGSAAAVTLYGAVVTPPRLAIVDSHCVGLDALVGRLAERRTSAQILSTGSRAGLAALRPGNATSHRTISSIPAAGAKTPVPGREHTADPRFAGRGFGGLRGGGA